MKKKIALLLVGAAIVTSLVGCGNSGASGDDTASNEATETTAENVEDSESSEGETATASWEVDGRTYTIPAYWTSIETTTDQSISAEQAADIIAASQSSEDKDEAQTAIFEAILNTTDISFDNTFLVTDNGLKDIIDVLGKPNYAVITLNYSFADDMDEEYEDGHYSFASLYVYKLDDSNKLIIHADETLVGRVEDDDSYYPLVSYAYVVSDYGEGLDFYTQNDVIESTGEYDRYMLEEKGTR